MDSMLLFVTLFSAYNIEDSFDDSLFPAFTKVLRLQGQDFVLQLASGSQSSSDLSASYATTLVRGDLRGPNFGLSDALKSVGSSEGGDRVLMLGEEEIFLLLLVKAIEEEEVGRRWLSRLQLVGVVMCHAEVMQSSQKPKTLPHLGGSHALDHAHHCLACCGGMLGHGSNVQRSKTMAIFDLKTVEFAIHGPPVNFAKCWPWESSRIHTHIVIQARLGTDGQEWGKYGQSSVPKQLVFSAIAWARQTIASDVSMASSRIVAIATRHNVTHIVEPNKKCPYVSGLGPLLLHDLEIGYPSLAAEPGSRRFPYASAPDHAKKASKSVTGHQ
ncbi:hypothetical protein VNO77_03320 [Canavalia gladiata]|uniref:Uncharacterized protein n=1 Tax=Canavalia gladiata TaxID=3824 RepID=A0AAN9MWI6_CANGL